MRAVVLAGGYGARLRPLTLRRPAALLPVAERPVIEYALEHLVRYGVDQATIALHHAASVVEPILGDGTRAGLRLDYSLERVPLGTAGAARFVAAGWRQPFVLAASTALVTADLSKVIAFHREKEALLTLVCATATAKADLTVDDDGQAGTPSTPGVGMIWQGLALLDPRVLAVIGRGEPCDLIDDVVPRLRRSGKAAQVYVAAEPGLMIRTPSDVLAANREAVCGNLPDLALPGFEVSPGVRLCRGARVHPSARLVAPVLVGPNALVGRHSLVASSVIGHEVIVGANSRISESVVLPRTHVGPGLNLRETVVDRDTLSDVARGAWLRIDDRRIVGDTRTLVALTSVSPVGRLGAAVLLTITAPLWLPCLAALTLATGRSPFRSRMVTGARGRPVRVRRVATRNRGGRCLAWLGLTRAPYVWSVLRGDLHWVGTTPRTPTQAATLVERGSEAATSRPGIVTLGHVVPLGLRWHDRLALDRLYAGTRTVTNDLWMLGSVLRRRLALWRGLRGSPSLF